MLTKRPGVQNAAILLLLMIYDIATSSVIQNDLVNKSGKDLQAIDSSDKSIHINLFCFTFVLGTTPSVI